MTGTYDRYFAAVAAADAGQAAAVLTAAVDEGTPPDELLRDVVGPAQRRAGELWFRGEWTVADEHAATGVAEQALTVVAPPRARRTDVPVVVLACAEGEWHTLPARLAAALAASGDVAVLPVGGSVPAEHLERHLRATRPAALALSATIATNLIGASRSIAAAHAEGVPVVVGGAAWGRDDARARRLGADAWLADPAELGDVVRGLAGRPLAPPVEVPREALLLDAVPAEALHLALDRQRSASPWLRGMTELQSARTLEDLRWIARHTAAALACDDPTIVRDLIGWLLALLTPRGVPPEAVLDSCHYLADSVEGEAPGGAALLRAEADAARASSA